MWVNLLPGDLDMIIQGLGTDISEYETHVNKKAPEKGLLRRFREIEQRELAEGSPMPPFKSNHEALGAMLDSSDSA